LEYFKMDYTLSVFKNEANFKRTINKEAIYNKLNIKPELEKPVLFQMINSPGAGGVSVDFASSSYKINSTASTTGSFNATKTDKFFNPSKQSSNDDRKIQE